MDWRVDPPRPGEEHMAADAALLNTGRVYTWDAPFVTLGKHQRVERAFLGSPQVPYCWRPTGGKAVLHGHDLTIGLSLPLDWFEGDRRSVGAVYRQICRPLSLALIDAGFDVVLGEDRGAHAGDLLGDCFAHVAPNDLVHAQTGQKVCGCALAIREEDVLLQASIPVRPPIVAPEEVLQQGISTFTPSDCSPEILAHALSRHFQT